MIKMKGKSSWRKYVSLKTVLSYIIIAAIVVGGFSFILQPREAKAAIAKTNPIVKRSIGLNWTLLEVSDARPRLTALFRELPQPK